MQRRSSQAAHAMGAPSPCQLRMRLLDLRNHTDLLEHIECPVCRNVCTPSNMLITCTVGEHHMCFACVVMLLLSSTDRLGSCHRCPVCRASLCTKRPPSTTLSIVSDILDGTPSRVNCEYTEVYHDFARSTFFSGVDIYSYKHIMLFTQLITHYGGLDQLRTMLELCLVYNVHLTYPWDMHRCVCIAGHV